MQIFANASSFASRKNAITKLTKVLGERLPDFQWMVITQEDGRFTPVVNLRDIQRVEAAALAHAGICVLG